MKKVVLILAAIGYFACACVALWPGSSPTRFTAAYAGMIVFALAALLSASKHRWLAGAAFLFAWAAACLSWLHYPQATLWKPSALGSVTWIRWSTNAGGNNHFFALTPVPLNWLNAEDLAVSQSGTLAVITSGQEQEFINNTFLLGGFEHMPLWIGLVRESSVPKSRLARVVEALTDPPSDASGLSEGFVWVDGKEHSYSNWKPGQPDNCGGNECYACINWFHSDSPPRGTKGDWNDAPLNGTEGWGGSTGGPYYGLMELDPEKKLLLVPISTPAGLATLIWMLLLIVLITALLLWPHWRAALRTAEST